MHCPQCKLDKGRTSVQLSDLEIFVLSIVRVAKSHSSKAGDHQKWQNQNRALINKACLLVFYCICSNKSWRWLWEQLWAQTALRNTFSLPLNFLLACLKPLNDSFPPPITFPCNTCATADLLTKTTQREVCMTWPLIISFNKKEKNQQNKNLHVFYLFASLDSFGKCYPAEFISTLSCCSIDK